MQLNTIKYVGHNMSRNLSSLLTNNDDCNFGQLVCGNLKIV